MILVKLNLSQQELIDFEFNTIDYGYPLPGSRYKYRVIRCQKTKQ